MPDRHYRHRLGNKLDRRSLVPREFELILRRGGRYGIGGPRAF